MFNISGITGDIAVADKRALNYQYCRLMFVNVIVTNVQVRLCVLLHLELFEHFTSYHTVPAPLAVVHVFVSAAQKDVRAPQYAVFRLQFNVIDGDRAPFLPTVTSGNLLQISEASALGSAVGRVSGWRYERLRLPC